MSINQDFQDQLSTLLNKHSVDNATNTPDYILAGNICVYIMGLQAMNIDRDKYYGINQSQAVDPYEQAQDLQGQREIITFDDKDDATNDSH